MRCSLCADAVSAGKGRLYFFDPLVKKTLPASIFTADVVRHRRFKQLQCSLYISHV